MKELNCKTEEELIEMMNDESNNEPLIIQLRKLFEYMDKEVELIDEAR